MLSENNRETKINLYKGNQQLRKTETANRLTNKHKMVKSSTNHENQSSPS